MRIKRICFLLLAFVFFMPFNSINVNVEAAAGVKGPVVLQWTRSDQNDNMYYSVGMGYADVWTNSNGEWIEDPYIGGILKPGMHVGEAHYDWEYQMIYPGRKVKSITALTFNKLEVSGETEDWIKQMFTTARFGATWEQFYDTFATVTQVNIKGTPKGLGTDTATIRINESFYIPTLLEKTPEKLDTSGLAKNVFGYRFYFPILFKAELEPIGGEAIIKHFTVDGKSLNGVDGFKDYKEKLVAKQDYNFRNTPGTTNYKYKGYKKSMTGAPSGVILDGEGPGNFTYDGSFAQYYVFFYYEGSGGDTGGGGGDPPGEGSVDCSDPSPAGQLSGEDFNPNVSAVIRADSRGNEKFNVLDGIPTTESLYGNVWSKSYLNKYEYQEMVGRCTFQVNVTVMPPPPDPNAPAPAPPAPGQQPEPDPGTQVQVTVEKEYSFWTIQDIQVFRIIQAALMNYAFNSNGIMIRPTGYNEPTYSTSNTSGYEPSDIPEDLEVPFDGDPQAAAERAVNVTVRNDTFIFNGQTLMNGSSSSNNGPNPSPIPISPMIGDNVLYSPGNVIPTSKINKADQPSTGTIYYGQVSGAGARNYPIYGINPVTVHTPVVMYPSVSDDAAHNQKTEPAIGRSAIILDRPFTVEMPNSGQHVNYKGYGYNNYLKYIGSKQVRFPFDVYDGNQINFYPKNTWIEVEKSKETFTFFLPVWVDEGFYEVEFRTIAHNAPSGASHQNKANLDLSHHIAYNTVRVDAIGRVYDFQVTDIADYNWESVFRASAGTAVPSGSSYWVGLNGIDGAPRGNAAPFTLPIRPGSHPLYKNAVIKTGYHFKFVLKTKGNMFGVEDRVRITPAFYYVSANNGTRTPVDLYYHAENRSYVKIGSPGDKVKRYVVLNDRLRNVPQEELSDTALYKYDHEYTFDQVAGISRSQYVNSFIQRASKQITPVGSLSLLELNAPIRTLIGPKIGIPSGVDSARVNASIQKWYGEYSLPADLYAVQKGTNVAEYGRTHHGLTDRSPIFLKGGYIVVNFNIETLRNGDGNHPYLQYIHAPLMNQWTQMEGYLRQVTDPYGRTFKLMDGDVVFYETDRSSRDDFRSMVTH